MKGTSEERKALVKQLKDLTDKVKAAILYLETGQKPGGDLFNDIFGGA